MNINQFDDGITQAVQGWPKWWRPVMIAASALADPHIMLILVVGSVWIAARMYEPLIATAFAWTLPAMLLNGVVKHFLHRPRPDTLYVSKMPFQSYSFPSGHAFCAAVLYGLGVFLAMAHMTAPWGYVVALGLTGLIAIIGVSRVYLGAHFPTDVIGGWLFGLVMLLLIVWGLRL